MNLADFRREYRAQPLSTSDLAPDPIVQFSTWFSVATQCPSIEEPNAMTLSTSDGEGEVSSRIVLLKGVDHAGFRFFTNLESRKARQIAANPKVALTFFWVPLERQVNITGSVEQLCRDESESYFASRPLQSKLGAWASQQSRVIQSRAELERAFEMARNRFPDGDVPTPPFWGGYLVRPSTMEFWQGGASRLHDRFRYTREVDTEWRIDRLSP